MLKILSTLICLLLAGCASVPIGGVPERLRAGETLIGSHAKSTKFPHREYYSYIGKDRMADWKEWGDYKIGDDAFFIVAPGQQDVYFRIAAHSAKSSFPRMVEAGGSFRLDIHQGHAYQITGNRNGDVFTVWIEDYISKERITEPIVIQASYDNPFH